MPGDAARFTTEPLREILTHLRATIARDTHAEILVPDPDLGIGLYPGELTHAGRHRPYQVWVDVADRLGAHLLTPTRDGNFVRLRFVRERTDRARPGERHAERYGADSDFQRVDKREDPCFLEDLQEALARAALQPGARVLSVGVNNGRELDVLHLTYPSHDLHVTGIDVSDTALALARERHPRHVFRVLDVNDLPEPELGRFDLIIALATLQSPGVDQDRVFRTLLREHLKPAGGIIIGLPNCRYAHGRVSYGARLLNYHRPELSLLLKDAALYRRHLQKHGFRVWVTGKYDVLVTAVRNA